MWLMWRRQKKGTLWPWNLTNKDNRRNGNTGQNQYWPAACKKFERDCCQAAGRKITIKEITDKAGVIRPTFYNHFQDKFELIEWIIRTELLEPVEPLIRNDMIIEAMVLLFTNIEKDKAFYSQLVKMEGSVKFHDIAKNVCGKYCLNWFKTKAAEGFQNTNGWRRRWYLPIMHSPCVLQQRNGSAWEWPSRRAKWPKHISICWPGLWSTLSKNYKKNMRWHFEWFVYEFIQITQNV